MNSAKKSPKMAWRTRLIITAILLIVAYLAGEFILSKFAPKALQYKNLPLLLSSLIYVPLASIRYMGIFVGLVVILLGLGSLWLTRHQAQITVEARSEVAPVAAAE